MMRAVCLPPTGHAAGGAAAGDRPRDGRQPRPGRPGDCLQVEAGTIRRPAAVALDILEWQSLDLAGLDWAAELAGRGEP